MIRIPPKKMPDEKFNALPSEEREKILKHRQACILSSRKYRDKMRDVLSQVQDNTNMDNNYKPSKKECDVIERSRIAIARSHLSKLHLGKTVGGHGIENVKWYMEFLQEKQRDGKTLTDVQIKHMAEMEKYFNEKGIIIDSADQNIARSFIVVYDDMLPSDSESEIDVVNIDSDEDQCGGRAGSDYDNEDKHNQNHRFNLDDNQYLLNQSNNTSNQDISPILYLNQNNYFNDSQFNPYNTLYLKYLYQFVQLNQFNNQHNLYSNAFHNQGIYMSGNADAQVAQPQKLKTNFSIENISGLNSNNNIQFGSANSAFKPVKRLH